MFGLSCFAVRMAAWIIPDYAIEIQSSPNHHPNHPKNSVTFKYI